MASVPATVVKRLKSAVPKFKRILASANERDVNESDTVTIVTDMLEEVFGFDKYSDVTREFAISGTYCDLAIKTGKSIDYLIEVKAIGLSLKGNHLKQAVNYAAREGVKWVVLTNGVLWQIHRVTLDQRVESEELCCIDFNQINPRKTEEIELLYLLCKRGLIRDNIDKFYEHRQSVNRYALGAILATENIAAAVRREVRKMKPGIKVSVEEIHEMITGEVLKREIIDSDAGREASKLARKYYRKQKSEREARRIYSTSKESRENPQSEG